MDDFTRGRILRSRKILECYNCDRRVWDYWQNLLHAWCAFQTIGTAVWEFSSGRLQVTTIKRIFNRLLVFKVHSMAESLNDENFPRLNWPVRFLDPIEHMWHLLGKLLVAYNQMPATIALRAYNYHYKRNRTRCLNSTLTTSS